IDRLDACLVLALEHGFTHGWPVIVQILGVVAAGRENREALEYLAVIRVVGDPGRCTRRSNSRRRKLVPFFALAGVARSSVGQHHRLTDSTKLRSAASDEVHTNA